MLHQRMTTFKFQQKLLEYNQRERKTKAQTNIPNVDHCDGMGRGKARPKPLFLIYTK